MEINTYGVKFLGLEVIKFDKLDELTSRSNYDWLLLCTTTSSDKYGYNESLSLIDAKKNNPLQLSSGWNVISMEYAFDNKKRGVHYFWLTLEDPYQKSCKFSERFDSDDYENVLLKNIKYIRALKQYDNILEFQLLEWKNFLGISFIEIYKEYMENPIYQKKVSKSHQTKIFQTNFKEREDYVELQEKKISELEADLYVQQEAYKGLQAEYNNLKKKYDQLLANTIPLLQ